MDGLLVDSEPLWKIAEKKIFGALGLELDDELLRQVMGFRLNEVVEHWYHYQSWPNPDFIKTENDILDCMEEFLSAHAVALPGVLHALEYSRMKGYKTALASSSSMRLIEVVVKRLGIRSHFDLLYSAEFELHGKPHPGIFLSSASRLESPAKNCMVLEDSVNGVIAAKAARMFCVAVPEAEKREDPRFTIADVQLKSLEELPDLLRSLKQA